MTVHKSSSFGRRRADPQRPAGEIRCAPGSLDAATRRWPSWPLSRRFGGGSAGGGENFIDGLRRIATGHKSGHVIIRWML